MGHSSIWKLICAISVSYILTVGVHLSSTPSISGPGSATAIFCSRFLMEPHPKQNGLKHFSSHPRSTKRRKSFQSMLKNVSIHFLTWFQLSFSAAHISRLTDKKIISQSKQHPTRFKMKFNLCRNKKRITTILTWSIFLLCAETILEWLCAK